MHRDPFRQQHLKTPAPSGGKVALVGAKKSLISIKADDGTSPPGKVVPVEDYIELKALIDGAGEGTFKWTTTSDKITLENADSGVVKIRAGKNFSEKLGAEVIKLEFTPKGEGALPPVSHKLTVVKVTISKSNNQKYGYDDMGNVKATLHHVSVKQNDKTKVKVTIQGGATGEVLFFTPDDGGTADATPPDKPGASFDLTINGKDRTKHQTIIRARVNSVTGPFADLIYVNVYKEKEITATIAKFHDSTKASTRLSRPKFGADLVSNKVTSWYRPAVCAAKYTDHDAKGESIDVHYDLNGNGKLDLEPAGISKEEKVILDAFKVGGQKVVIVNKLAWIYLLKSAASKDDDQIVLKDAYSGYMKFIGVNETYTLGAGDSEETIKVKSKTGNTVKLYKKLTKDHTTDDGLIWPLSGLSGNPIYVAESGKTEDKECETCGHECGHSLMAWLDLVSEKNLMHFSIGRTGVEIRYKDQPRKYDAGDDNQWEKVSR